MLLEVQPRLDVHILCPVSIAQPEAPTICVRNPNVKNTVQPFWCYT